MTRVSGLLASAVTGTILLVESALAYNSEEHKLLVDLGASMVVIDPSIQLPAPTRMRSQEVKDRRAFYIAAKYFAVGVRNNSGTVRDDIKGVQDNSYWSGDGWDQTEYNKKIYIPEETELRSTTLEVAGWTGRTGAPGLFTMGELAAIYGDYRRTVYCETGTCYLTNGNAANIRFDMGEDCYFCATCFPSFKDCGWEPGPFAFEQYLRYIASGLVPPYTPTLYGNADMSDFDEAAWWGDEMIRIAAANDSHFSSGAVAWYVGCHRLALYYASLARNNPAYWNQALHYEACGLHSLTDLFAFGHVVTNADRRTQGISENASVTTSHPYRWMKNVFTMGGASRDGEGRVSLNPGLPPIAEYPTRMRSDLMNTTTVTWANYAIQEKDFHDCYNASGGDVRNLAGDSFTIYGDDDIEKTTGPVRAIIAEAVRASIQSLFDGYVDLGRGRTLAEVTAAGSSFYAALKKLPVFVVKNREWYCIGRGPRTNITTGNNYNGRWTLYAEFLDVLTGANIVPPTNCVMRYEDGAREIDGLQPDVACTKFPAIVPTPHGETAEIQLEQSSPNPFVTSVTIRFTLSSPAHVVLELFDLKGSVVRTLLREDRPQGPQFATWDATNDTGVPVAGGLYFYKLSIGGKSRTRMMTFTP